MESVKLQIEKLTDDEDKKQELWLHHISGNSTVSLATKLEKIEQEKRLYEKFCKAVKDMYVNPPSSITIEFLSNFTDFERSIMFLLLLGFSVDEVSEYKGISKIRIQQSIVAIGKHSAWEKYGTKA